MNTEHEWLPKLRWPYPKISPEEASIRGAHQRCYNPKNERYSRYGGRGITVSPRWSGKQGVQNFIEDMGQRPTSGHSLDRINNDGNYEPGNCRWATAKEQSNNRRCPWYIRKTKRELETDSENHPVND